jgi:hypothetical protein
MRTYLFGKYSIGDKVILAYFQNALEGCEYLGEKVDLSRIKPEEENLIVVTNPSLFKIDLDKVLGYIKKDCSKPLVVLRKVKTFATFFFEPNFKLEKVTTNKAYTFAGILYVPKKYLAGIEDKQTMAGIFRSVPKDDWRYYFISHN